MHAYMHMQQSVGLCAIGSLNVRIHVRSLGRGGGEDTHRASHRAGIKEGVRWTKQGKQVHRGKRVAFWILASYPKVGNKRERFECHSDVVYYVEVQPVPTMHRDWGVQRLLSLHQAEQNSTPTRLKKHGVHSRLTTRSVKDTGVSYKDKKVLDTNRNLRLYSSTDEVLHTLSQRCP